MTPEALVLQLLAELMADRVNLRAQLDSTQAASESALKVQADLVAHLRKQLQMIKGGMTPEEAEAEADRVAEVAKNAPAA